MRSLLRPEPWLDAQAMPLRVLDEHGSRVEAHGLVVQDGGGENRQVVDFSRAEA
jgi:hypothetical protein